MELLKRAYRKILSPVYRKIEFETERERQERLQAVQQLSDETERLKEQLDGVKSEFDGVKSELGGIHNSIQYFSDTMAEKSYLIQCNSDELKRQMYELKKHDIRIRSLLIQDAKNTGRVLQVVPVFCTGDAIGDYALFIDRTLRAEGIRTDIYAYRNLSEHEIKPVEELDANASDVILLHMAAENDFAEIMEAYPAKKVLCYHNITPSEFFRGFDDTAEQSTKNGRLQVERLASAVDCCITDSEYNKAELRAMGYRCPVYVLAIPFEKKSFASAESRSVKEKLSDGKTNLIFVGRIAPNKKLEDVIRCYQRYKDVYNQNARLLLVGSYDGGGRYYQYLREQLREGDDVIFTGHVNAEEWITYYRYADVFVCMSEHEGYCVPLIEAMSLGLPVVAYRSSAIPGTLGEGGILFDEKDMDRFAAAIHTVVTSGEAREELRRKQLLEMKRYDVERIKAEFIGCIGKIMEECHNDSD